MKTTELDNRFPNAFSQKYIFCACSCRVFSNASWATDKAEAELRRTLLESDDAALAAQREHFPEHYETVVRLLARMRGGDPLDASAARQALGRYSARNWNLYTRRVRRAAPADWKRLLTLRRDLLDLIDRGHGPYLCRRYEQGGAQVLIDADRERYRGPVGAYIAAFLEVAARAGPEAPDGEAAEERLEAGMADLNELYRSAQERSGDPHLLAALRPGPLLHSRYCAATVQVLTTALETAAPLGPRLWRYLVTQPAGR